MRGRLADLMARQVEVGRIRLGTTETKTSKQGKEYQAPVKLDRFRLTSRSQQLIEEAAGLYGGSPEAWTPGFGGAQQWEVIVVARSLPIIVPPDPLSQFYELWASGKVQRRCDGDRELLGDTACLCRQANPDPARRQCKPYTRLSVMLAEMNGVGVWRLETKGYNAAVELPAVADLLSRAGGNVPARLEMEERQATVEVNGKEQISRFMVPVIHVEMAPAAIVGSFRPRNEIEGPTQDIPALGPGPASPTAVVPPDEPEPDLDYPDPNSEEGVYDSLLRRIGLASDRDTMMALRTQVADCGLTEPKVTELKTAWNLRAKILAANGATKPVPQAATSAPAPTLDRGQIWRDIMTWAGHQNLVTSQVAARFKAWGRGGDDIKQADASMLDQFRKWLLEGGQ